MFYMVYTPLLLVNIEYPLLAKKRPYIYWENIPLWKGRSQFLSKIAPEVETMVRHAHSILPNAKHNFALAQVVP